MRNKKSKFLIICIIFLVFCTVFNTFSAPITIYDTDLNVELREQLQEAYENSTYSSYYIATNSFVKLENGQIDENFDFENTLKLLREINMRGMNSISSIRKDYIDKRSIVMPEVENEQKTENDIEINIEDLDVENVENIEFSENSQTEGNMDTIEEPSKTAKTDEDITIDIEDDKLSEK